MKSPFDVIDKVYLINLPERTDRLMDSMYEIEKVGLKNRVEVVEGVKKGNAGLIETMISIFEQSNETILILEDDIRFVNNPVKTFKIAYEQVRLQDWDLLYLGASIRQPLVKRYPNWFRLVYGMTTHAVIYNKKIIPSVLKLFKTFKNKPAISDRLLATWIQPYYSCLLIDPMIAVQRPSHSNIQDMATNYDIEKQFRKIQK